MRKSAHLLLILYFGLCATSCISFKIIPSFPLEGYVETIVICSEVDESGELLKPKEIKSEYTPEDESLYCFIELQNISRRIRMRWRWYGPDKTMSQESEEVIINRAEQYLETLTAYDELILNDQELVELIGRWTVVVLIDDQLVARRKFSIRENKNNGKQVGGKVEKSVFFK